MSYTVVAIFPDAADARDAVERLTSSGFTDDNIDLSRANVEAESSETEGEGLVGRIKRFFHSLFRSDDEAERYSDAAQASDAIITVHVISADEATAAARILDDAGALDVDEAAMSGADEDAEMRQPGMPDEAIGSAPPEVLEAVEVVETEGLRLHSRIFEYPIDDAVRLREERIVVERAPADRPASEAELATFQAGQLGSTEHAEMPAVAKKARVAEPAERSKAARQSTEPMRQTVASTEAKAEDIEAGKAPSGGEGQETPKKSDEP